MVSGPRWRLAIGSRTVAALHRQTVTAHLAAGGVSGGPDGLCGTAAREGFATYGCLTCCRRASEPPPSSTGRVERKVFMALLDGTVARSRSPGL